ncbi:Oidioi.mRNA.OKI2018_I69.chr1.g1359.t1.cds [Oikopleura dioica]|uniref:Oidioi.mRNA.OKI2018_I69.chr1.g1359.t1.cds n=1 Tax=Oikopleura dioica TaxID=34765 RepID=A0ABN7SRG1_OIKDI|nr:Oidioi.mRNA.OKI2018_I69.chr1.g1359.t1.cds [Oikopleura dioica]
MKLFSLFASASAAYSYETTEPYTTSTSIVSTTERFTDCGGTIKQPTTFSSPDFGSENYQNFLSCTWNISLRGVAGFWIVPKTFDIESVSFWWASYPDYLSTLPKCAFDHVKVIANEVESNFCGSNAGDRTIGDEEKGGKEGGKWVPDLVNVSEEGFPKMFVLGSQATVSMFTDFSNENTIEFPGNDFKGFEFELIEADRLDIIEHHFGRIAASLADGKKSGRYVNRFQKVLEKARASSTGENCYEENGFGASDSSDDVQVFDESDMCTLNSQVNAALNSWARNNACDGRGKVYRQIIRAARKIRNFYNSVNDC